MRNRVEEFRANREWSQQHLTDELGVSRQTIISIERGRFDPSLPLAFRPGSLFGSTIEDLFIPDDYSPGTPGTSHAPGAPPA
ncbi:helix-turn-helix transcriptional regulator [Arthrobacter sp. 08Y14]|uniref:helix-turn-helix transcriptional regulator n=1 Tax=Arthrobacter sp. 08Y14 TaxID=2058885 RepID=UPI000CE4C6E1|nr:helix-turn-helix transcriptional regulator [Arthrobacter sp. 08Y14]